MIGTAAVEAAVTAALREAAIVPADRVVSGPVADPAVLGFPFIEIGETQTLSDDVTGHDGVEEFLTLHIWSRSGDQAEVKAIIGRIADAINALSLAVDGFGSVYVFIRDSQVRSDAYGFNWHAIVTLQIHAHAA